MANNGTGSYPNHDDASLFVRFDSLSWNNETFDNQTQEWDIYFVTNTKVVECYQLTLTLFLIDVKDV